MEDIVSNNAFGPIIGKFIATSMMYLGIPFILLSLNVFDVKITPKYSYLGAPLTIVMIIFYLMFIFSNFIPGIYAIFDCVTKNYSTQKMMYVNSCIIDQGLNTTSGGKERVVLSDNKGTSSYLSTILHDMERGEYYMVTYGKLSKIIVAIAKIPSKKK
jgi:hypothetical protein